VKHTTIRELQKRRRSMNYMDFNPCLTRERNEGLLREVSTLRLQKRLRENRQPRSSRLVVLVQRGTLPMLRKAGLVA
jgi:hypothetical protein